MADKDHVLVCDKAGHGSAELSDSGPLQTITYYSVTPPNARRASPSNAISQSDKNKVWLVKGVNLKGLPWKPAKIILPIVIK